MTGEPPRSATNGTAAPTPPALDEVIRAWHDPLVRAALSDDELARLPASPVGVPTLDDLPED